MALPPDSLPDPAAVPPADTIRPEWWLILYEDPDRQYELFTDEAPARERYKRASLTWNCTLLASESVLLAVGERDKAEIERLRQRLVGDNKQWRVDWDALCGRFTESQAQGERDRQQIAQLTAAADAAVLNAVDRWHESDPTEQRSLAQWLGVTEESYTDWVMSGDVADLRFEPDPPRRFSASHVG